MTAAANIGPREQWKRLGIGGATMAMGIGLAAALTSAGANRWWRLALFLPFWMGARGVLQAKEKI